MRWKNAIRKKLSKIMKIRIENVTAAAYFGKGI